MIYNIGYAADTEQELKEQRIFKYINTYDLYNLEYVKEITEGTNPLDLDIEDQTIQDRDTATDYIRQHRQYYAYVGFYETGLLHRVLCLEKDDTNKPTAALYDHPEHGLIWLEMY